MAPLVHALARDPDIEAKVCLPNHHKEKHDRSSPVQNDNLYMTTPALAYGRILHTTYHYRVTL